MDSATDADKVSFKEKIRSLHFGSVDHRSRFEWERRQERAAKAKGIEAEWSDNDV